MKWRSSIVAWRFLRCFGLATKHGVSLGQGYLCRCNLLKQPLQWCFAKMIMPPKEYIHEFRSKWQPATTCPSLPLNDLNHSNLSSTCSISLYIAICILVSSTTIYPRKPNRMKRPYTCNGVRKLLVLIQHKNVRQKQSTNTSITLDILLSTELDKTDHQREYTLNFITK